MGTNPWPSMMRTYLHEQARYDKCFVGGWYLSGDLAMRDAQGYFWFVGRADDLIKTSGHLIGPFEVESARWGLLRAFTPRTAGGQSPTNAAPRITKLTLGNMLLSMFIFGESACLSFLSLNDSFFTEKTKFIAVSVYFLEL